MPIFFKNCGTLLHTDDFSVIVKHEPYVRIDCVSDTLYEAFIVMNDVIVTFTLVIHNK